MANTHGTGSKKSIMITSTEREEILHSIALANSSANDKDQIISRPFRMCAIIPVTFPICVYLVCGKPTFGATIAVHWINQSWNAGFNYGNKNSSSTFTNEDLAVGYAAAVTSSISVALLLGKLAALSGGKNVTGRKLLAMNLAVNGTANAIANFCNSYFMRKAEAK